MNPFPNARSTLPHPPAHPRLHHFAHLAHRTARAAFLTLFAAPTDDQLWARMAPARTDRHAAPPPNPPPDNARRLDPSRRA